MYERKIHILSEYQTRIYINTLNKLYRACRHKTKIHGCMNYTISSDDELFIPERVSQHTTRPVSVSPRERDLPFLCRECISTNWQLDTDQNSNTRNARAICSVFYFETKNEQQNIVQNLNSEICYTHV